MPLIPFGILIEVTQALIDEMIYPPTRPTPDTDVIPRRDRSEPRTSHEVAIRQAMIFGTAFVELPAPNKTEETEGMRLPFLRPPKEFRLIRRGWQCAIKLKDDDGITWDWQGMKAAKA